MKTLTAILLCTLAAACGNSSTAAAGTTTAEYKANAPTYDKMALSQNDSDEAEPAMVREQPGTALAGTTEACHPHLFQDAGSVILRVNTHFFRHLHHVEELIAGDPTLSTDGSKTWENVKNGIDRKLTITATANADASITYAFELDLAKAATPASTETFVKVMSGSITHSGSDAAASDAGAASAEENKGEANFDFDALAQVDTTETARGQIADTFDNVVDPVKGIKRSASITLTNFIPEGWQFRAHGPQNGTYKWEREPGVGGFFQYADALELGCPQNSAGAVADIQVVARWYNDSGAVHGRGDALATGGQIPAGDKWVGLTCASGSSSAAPAEGEWLMKEEDASGNTILVNHVQAGLTPCDAAFGAVPDENDSAHDYDFTAAVTFPNEW